MKQTGAITAFQERILNFYGERGRNLPWRRTTDPYRILVSEIMLQQTQVERVIPFYERWLDRWSSPKALAKAELKEVLSLWMGLGYNNRAKRLLAAAATITTDYDGDVLAACRDYRHLPGVGEYTSKAVRIFAANEDLAAIDTNIRRIYIAEFSLDNPSPAEILKLAEQCLPRGRSRDWHNALMDYGALHLTAAKSGISPVSKQSAFAGSVRQLRAQIVRELLTKGTIPLAAYQDDHRFAKALSGLQKEGLCRVEGQYLLIP
ncbi:MAG: Fe-S cluster assembly protein HesB [Deltaproteobacteria bacterium]|nr:Fe-S cluster assembly protein HesB [Candidatus Anaeroferrophillus wilburensis]MBN2889403.1 Fe-S cluster assembly protein HesB [Deltaproteobacteria bacterium]